MDKKNKTLYLVAFILVCLVLIFEVFAYTHYVIYLKEGGNFDFVTTFKEHYTQGFTTGLSSIIVDILSLLLFFLLPFVIQFASIAPVTAYVYIAYGLNIFLGIATLLFNYLAGDSGPYSSTNYETTTIKTTYDLSSGTTTQSVKTPQDKADAANFWLNVLVLVLFIALPYILIPILLFFLIKKAAFVKGKWFLTALLLLATIALTVILGYGLLLLV